MTSNPMLATFPAPGLIPGHEYWDTGFRIAYPEPTALALGRMLAGCALLRRRRKS
jgi:hypothetical protein